MSSGKARIIAMALWFCCLPVSSTGLHSQALQSMQDGPELVTQANGRMEYGVTAAFGPNGRWLASVAPAGEVLLYDLVGGRVSHRFESTSGKALMAVHPVKDEIAVLSTVAASPSLQLYDVSRGVVIWNHPVEGFCEALHFSADGSRLMGVCSRTDFGKRTSYAQGALLGWDAETGTEVKMPPIADGYVAGTVFSEDGRWVTGAKPLPDMGSSSAPKKINIFASIKLSMQAMKAMQDRAILDTETGHVVAKIAAFNITSMSAKAHTIVTYGINGTAVYLLLVDISSSPAKSIATLPGIAASTQVSPDGRYFLLSSFGNSVLVDAKTGVTTQPGWGTVPYLSSAAIAPDDDEVAFVQSGSVILTRISKPEEKRTVGSSLALLFTAEAPASSIVSPAAKADSDLKSTLPTGSDALLETIPVYGAIRESRRHKREERHEKQMGRAANWSGVPNTTSEQSMKNTMMDAMMKFGGPVMVPPVVSFLDSGRLMAVRTADASWGLWDVATGNHLTTQNTFKFDTMRSENPEAWLNEDDLHNLETTFGTPALRLNRDAGNASDTSERAYAPDRRQIFTHPASMVHEDDPGERIGNPQGFGLQILDASDQKVLFDIPEAFGNAKLIAVSPNGHVLLDADRSATLGLWDRKTGQRIGTLYAYQEGEWLLTTPSGLFDGSPRGWQQIAWRDPNGDNLTLPGEAFFSEFYRPGLLAELLTGNVPKPPRTMAQIDRRQPIVQLTVDATANMGTALLHVGLTEAGSGARPGGVRDVRLFRNGVLVKAWRGDQKLNGGTASLDATVPLVVGENHFTAYAFNQDNVKSLDAEKTIQSAGAPAPRTAYIVVVGVNQYSNPEFNLNFAEPDARHFSESLEQSLKETGKYERIVQVNLLNQDATRENLLDSLAVLTGQKKVFETATVMSGLRQTHPEDTVVLYFAGHGLASRDHFYLIPHDLGYDGSREDVASSIDEVLQHGISDLALEQALDGLDAANILLVIDACNSGKALDADEVRRGPMNSKGLAQLAYEKGMYVLTASQAYQSALESSKLGHGYLTYALTDEGLKTTQADTAPADGKISVVEWFEYAARRVPQMQSEALNGSAGGRQLKFESEVTVPSDKLNASGIVGRLQTPRLYYRREQTGNELIVSEKK